MSGAGERPVGEAGERPAGEAVERPAGDAAERPPRQAERSSGEALTLAAAQAEVDAWISRFREGYWPPLVNLARLVEEVGELSRELNHRYGPKRKKAEEAEADLGEEIADVLFVLIALANEQGIELEDALRRVLAKYRARDSERWPR